MPSRFRSDNYVQKSRRSHLELLWVDWQPHRLAYPPHHKHVLPVGSHKCVDHDLFPGVFYSQNNFRWVWQYRIRWDYPILHQEQNERIRILLCCQMIRAFVCYAEFHRRFPYYSCWFSHCRWILLWRSLQSRILGRLTLVHPKGLVHCGILHKPSYTAAQRFSWWQDLLGPYN